MVLKKDRTLDAYELQLQLQFAHYEKVIDEILIHGGRDVELTTVLAIKERIIKEYKLAGWSVYAWVYDRTSSGPYLHYKLQFE